MFSFTLTKSCPETLKTSTLNFSHLACSLATRGTEIHFEVETVVSSVTHTPESQIHELYPREQQACRHK